MGTVIKVVIGMIVGAVGFWALDRYVVEADIKAGQDIEIKKEVPLSDNNVSGTPNNKISDVQEKDKARNVESLTNELESLKRQMEVTNQELLASKLESQRLNTLLKGNGASRDGLKSEQNTTSDKSSNEQNKFEGIPESHHKLLSRPDSMPKATYELHDDFVNEQEDVSWAAMKEQQINYFLMNYKDSSWYTIHGVECRSTLCEIFGTEHPSDRDVWNEVIQQMRSQPWWEFGGTHSRSTTDSNGNLLFATILKRGSDN